MTSPKNYNDQNEIDLSKFIIHLWDNKLKILIITAITIIIVFVFQNFKEPAKPKYNSETQIRPITNFDEAKYVFYNSYLKIINEKNYLDLNAINQNLIQKNLYSPSFSSSLIINKSFLIGLFIDKLNQNSTFIEPIKKFELVKKENYPNNSEYESAVIKLASMIKLVPPVKNENKIYWTIHIKDFEKNNLRDFLKFVEEKANQEIRLYLESTFKKRIESEKKLINYEIEDLNIQISQNPYNEGEQKISFISYVYTKNSSTTAGIVQNNQNFASDAASNQKNSDSGDITLEKSDEDIITEAIQTTGATSLIDIVKIIKHIKEKTGKEVDENLAISLLQKRLKNL